jgi:hypothetical protein
MRVHALNRSIAPRFGGMEFAHISIRFSRLPSDGSIESVYRPRFGDVENMRIASIRMNAWIERDTPVPGGYHGIPGIRYRVAGAHSLASAEASTKL